MSTVAVNARSTSVQITAAMMAFFLAYDMSIPS
jgi:hypothetical protein